MKDGQIANIDQYTHEMAKSVNSKLFFLNYIQDFDQIIDFGCADGYLLREIEKLNLNKILAGYDISPKMIELARLEKSHIYFTEYWNNLFIGKDTLILLSSVIHEVYSYGNRETIKQFYKNVFKSKAKYIVIRDMFLSKNVGKQEVDLSDVEKIKSKTHNIYSSFKYHNGEIKTQRDLIHYLLKYRYQENWVREVNENYFPIYLENFLQRIPINWELIHKKEMQVPFSIQKIKEDYNIGIDFNTHAELIFRRK